LGEAPWGKSAGIEGLATDNVWQNTTSIDNIDDGLMPMFSNAKHRHNKNGVGDIVNKIFN